MHLGYFKGTSVFALFLFLTTSAGAQPGKIFRYHLNDNPKKNDVRKRDNSIIIDYSISDLNIESVDSENGIFYRINIPGHTKTSEPGKPELPVFSTLITVPDNFTFSIKISNVKSTRIKPSDQKFEGQLFPAQESETKNLQKEKPAFAYNKESYATKGLIHRDTIVIEHAGIVRNNHLSNIVISPVRYNPKSNIIEVITSMKIEVTLFPEESTSSKSGGESAVFAESLTKGVSNYNQEDLITGYSDKPLKMIILTDTSFLKNLKPFIRWKTQKGFKIKVLSMGAGKAGTNYSELKNSISAVYNATSDDEPNPEYLLIIGDVNKVPYYGTGNVTDMYYGEFDGNGDYLPEMFVGRLPVSDTNQLKIAIGKIIQYEKFEFADTSHFHSNALLSAGYDESYATIMNSQLKYAVDYYLTSANRIKEQHFYYPSSYTAKESFINLLNKGTSFINYTGHGEANGWLHLNIKVADTALMKNRSMYPVIISNACKTAQFSLAGSFGNNMMLVKNKGAIGFIGCSNDSYWDEDLYWAIGTGNNTGTPTYENTGLGAYDRLFHTHNESASNWYVSLGQINYAGNLSVSTSTSSRKKYYWETYNVVGDPSLIPIIGTPDTFKLSLPDTLPNKMKSLSFNADPFSYVAVSHWDTLWDASYASPSGSVNLNMPGLSNDSCLIVVTGQNKIPIIKTIHFTDISKEFLNITSSNVNDNLSNNDGKADYGETLSLTLKISNLGLTAAEGVSARLSASSEWATINNDYLEIGKIKELSDTTIARAFNITISDIVPDEGTVSFDLVLKDLHSEKHYTLDINVHSPELEILSCKVDDSSTGNRNFNADPGEIVNLIFQVRNQGSASTSGDLNITSPDENLILLNSSISSGILRRGETVEISVPAKFSENAAIGNIISFVSTLTCSPYVVNRSFSLRIGKIRESFESSSFRIFPWINMSSVPWTNTGSVSVEGNFSARSGSITHNGITTLMIRTVFSASDSIKFYYKVSSEINYDYFSFLINGKEVFKKSGESGWEKKAFSVAKGINKFEWKYKKDNTVSNGSDAAWVDLIDFSSAGSVKFIQKDLETVRIVAPVQQDDYGKELIAVKVYNVGRDTLNGFNLGYTINNNYIPVKQHFDNKVYPYKDTVIVAFDTRADLSKYGVYNIRIFGYNNGDDYFENDTVKIKLENTTIDEPLIVFPNPFDEQLRVVINSKLIDDVRITLVSLSGMTVYVGEKHIIQGENTILLDNEVYSLPSGLYYLDIRGSTISKNIPVVKMRQ